MALLVDDVERRRDRGEREINAEGGRHDPERRRVAALVPGPPYGIPRRGARSRRCSVPLIRPRLLPSVVVPPWASAVSMPYCKDGAFRFHHVRRSIVRRTHALYRHRSPSCRTSAALRRRPAEERNFTRAAWLLDLVQLGAVGVDPPARSGCCTPSSSSGTTRRSVSRPRRRNWPPLAAAGAAHPLDAAGGVQGGGVWRPGRPARHAAVRHHAGDERGRRRARSIVWFICAAVGARQIRLITALGGSAAFIFDVRTPAM